MQKTQCAYFRLHNMISRPRRALLLDCENLPQPVDPVRSPSTITAKRPLGFYKRCYGTFMTAILSFSSSRFSRAAPAFKSGVFATACPPSAAALSLLASPSASFTTQTFSDELSPSPPPRCGGSEARSSSGRRTMTRLRPPSTNKSTSQTSTSTQTYTCFLFTSVVVHKRESFSFLRASFVT